MEVCWFARIPWRAAGTPPGIRFGIRMKEWVKKEEGVSFGETSEQQPTGYAAHSDHNGRCNPCVGEGVLLVVAQVLAGKAQQQEGGTRQGTEREAQRHLAHDGSLCHSQCVAAHSGNSVGDDRHPSRY